MSSVKGAINTIITVCCCHSGTDMILDGVVQARHKVLTWGRLQQSANLQPMLTLSAALLQLSRCTVDQQVP